MTESTASNEVDRRSTLDPARATGGTRVVMLQRAIAHYRLELFEKLRQQSAFDWTFYGDQHDQTVSTGVASPFIDRLGARPIRNQRIIGPFVFQTGVRLKGSCALMLDLGWTIVSNPRYLIEARLRGIATIGWSKGIPQNPDKPESKAKRLYQKSILNLCDCLVVYGDISKEYFLRLGFPEDRLFIARNTIDTARIARALPAAKEQKQRLLDALQLKGRFVFGYLGGLVARKKVECIIAAFNQVRAQGISAALIIAGSGPDKPNVEATVAASPFKADIFLVGLVPVGEEGGWFQLFDVYLSFAEGGLGIVEAMAHGKVVVSTPERYPETELLDDGNTALLSTDRTVGAFARCMASAANQADRFEMIGANAKDRVLSESTLENMVLSIDRALSFALRR